jgi:predicted MPP superfamily phosphohydrolase
VRVVFVQLSDIHFRSASNPISARVTSLLAAIRSIAPKPDFCFVLVTGDVAWSGQNDEYKNAQRFFSDLRADLSVHFGGSNLHFEFIPGNHDCFLPVADEELRAVIVRGIQTTLHTKSPDSGMTSNLISSQNNFFELAEKQGCSFANWKEKLFSSTAIQAGDRRIRIHSFNTAFLSQRKEIVGSLALPRLLLENDVRYR